MSGWNKISLYKFQQAQAIARNEKLSDVDRGLFAACVVFDYTEYEFDNLPKHKVNKCLKVVNEIFSSPFDPAPVDKIGEYVINYYLETIRFGQYVELAHFFSQDMIINAHNILASVTNIEGLPNQSDDHQVKAGLFLLQPVSVIMGTIKKIKDCFTVFNAHYKDLFGLDKEDAAEITASSFFKIFGWVYSATRVSDHEKITLDEAYNLPVTTALNDLRYLKAKDKFEEQQAKK